MTSTKPLIVGIAGGTGSGKSTVVRNIAERLPAESVSVIEYDNYYHDNTAVPLEVRHHANYDHPDALDNALLIEHLDLLRAGKPADAPQYDFVLHARRPEPKRVNSAPILIVDGILLFVDERVRQRLDIKLFVDTDPDVRLFRRINRDLESRGRTLAQVREQYFDSVRPMHEKFVEPSKQWADLIIPEGGNNHVALDLVVSKLRNVARRSVWAGDPARTPPFPPHAIPLGQTGTEGQTPPPPRD